MLPAAAPVLGLLSGLRRSPCSSPTSVRPSESETFPISRRNWATMLLSGLGVASFAFLAPSESLQSDATDGYLVLGR